MMVRISVWMTALLVCAAMGDDLHAQIPLLPSFDPPPPFSTAAESNEAPPVNLPAADKKSALAALIESDPQLSKELEGVIEKYLKKREGEKKIADEAKKKDAEEKKKAEEELKNAEILAKTSGAEVGLNLPILYDSLHPFPMPAVKSKKWYDTMSIRGYTQFRFDRTLDTDPGSATPNLFGDRAINGSAENFFIRRLRFIFSGDIGEHMSYYIQPDFASNLSGAGAGAATFYAQMRDAYADVYFDKERVNRLRIGLSKVPYGWENLQSSINRIPLDRTDAMNTAVAPNERDLGIIYYWTPVAKQQLLKALVDSGLKGSGNFGIFGIGVYDGQGGAVNEANLNLHSVARFTWPWQLDWKNGQVMEASIQGYMGDYVVSGAAIRPNGVGNTLITPTGTGGIKGIFEERVAASFVVFPQPFGFQAEWEVGSGPGLNNQQTAVVERSLYGGYLMGMYRYDSHGCGIFTPYVRWQQYKGGYRNLANAPYGQQRELNLGIEWQITKAMELVCEYDIVNTPNFSAINTPASPVANLGRSYRDFEGNCLRFQFQINY